jgi:hypothetical protein
LKFNGLSYLDKVLNICLPEFLKIYIMIIIHLNVEVSSGLYLSGDNYFTYRLTLLKRKNNGYA